MRFDFEPDEFRAGFRRLLEPHERLLALTDFSRAEGRNLLPDPPAAKFRERTVLERTLLIIFFPLLLLLALNAASPPSLSRMFGGVTAAGRAGSWACRLHEAYHGLLGKSRSQAFMVTDRRLLLASRKIWGKEPDYAVNFEIPREALARAALESRPFTRGRVVLYFTDESMYALKLGTYRTGTTRSLVQALTGPESVRN